MIYPVKGFGAVMVWVAVISFLAVAFSIGAVAGADLHDDPDNTTDDIKQDLDWDNEKVYDDLSQNLSTLEYRFAKSVIKLPVDGAIEAAKLGIDVGYRYPWAAAPIAYGTQGLVILTFAYVIYRRLKRIPRIDRTF